MGQKPCHSVIYLICLLQMSADLHPWREVLGEHLVPPCSGCWLNLVPGGCGNELSPSLRAVNWRPRLAPCTWHRWLRASKSKLNPSEAELSLAFSWLLLPGSLPPHQIQGSASHSSSPSDLTLMWPSLTIASLRHSKAYLLRKIYYPAPQEIIIICTIVFKILKPSNKIVTHNLS